MAITLNVNKQARTAEAAVFAATGKRIRLRQLKRSGFSFA